MKKYINSVSFFFLIFILFPSLVSAVSSSYYQKIFDEWGIKADIYQGETKVGLEGFLKAGENKERQSVDSNNTKPNVSRLVLLSSQLEGGFNVSDYSDKYTEFYIVCDVEMVMESNSCSGLGFENENQVVNTEDAKILVTENNKKKLNLIPQNYFVIPSTRKDLGIYFKASQVSFEQQKQGDIPNKPGILSKTPLLLLGLSQYALYIFIIITFTYGVLIHSRNKTTLTCFIKRIYSDHRILYFRLKSYRGMLLYAAMFLFFILILIIYVITLKDNGSFSFEGMSSVFNSIIKLNK